MRLLPDNRRLICIQGQEDVAGPLTAQLNNLTEYETLKLLLKLAQKNSNNTENKKQKKESGLAEEKQSGEKVMKKMIRAEIKEKEDEEE